MHLGVVVLDYDGTIATSGVLDQDVRSAILELRAAGVTVVLATGLRALLRALRLSEHNALAIGDAENDHTLLEACEIGVAVGWGSQALKLVADEVIDGDGPAAVAPYLRELCRRERSSIDMLRR